MKRENVPKSHVQELHRMIGEVFREAADRLQWDWHRLAAEANLSYSTVCKLGDLITVLPQFLTICKLAEAVGWKIREAKPKRKGSPPSVVIALPLKLYKPKNPRRKKKKRKAA